MDVEKGADGEVSVAGNACPRGAAYAKSEMLSPARMVTGLVRVAWMRRPLPVKTASPVPKGKIPEVLVAMRQATVKLPVKIGDVVVADVAGTGVDLVATSNM